MSLPARARFSSKLGLVLAAAGSAVGLGNIWRFPTQAGENGGSAFILIYILCILMLGFPLMIAESMIGRHARSNTGSAFAVLAPGTHWKWLGRFSVLAAFLIFSYYNVVAGWTLAYVWEAAAGKFMELAAMIPGSEINPFASNFTSFISNPWQPIMWLVIFMAMTHFVVVRGVENGIERFSKILMPLLFIMLLALAGCSLSMPGAKEGLQFLFKLDFSAINGEVVLSALGQCFFSLSLGMGCLCTYASYFRRDANLAKTGLSIAALDTLVAILAGVIIFPAVFSVPGLEPDQGASLVFIALPNVFHTALDGLPVLPWLVPVMFYLLLVIATLTSTISLHEVITAFVSETFGTSRHKAAWIVSCSTVILGCICSLSMGPWENLKLFGMDIFTFFDFFTAKLMLPTAAFFIAVFVGWKMRKVALWRELTSYGAVKFKGVRPFIFLMRFIVPILILLIMVSELGLI